MFRQGADEHPGLDGNVSPDKFYDWQRRQQLLALIEILSASKALQNFGQYQVSGRDRFVTEEGIEPVGLRGLRAMEIVDLQREARQTGRLTDELIQLYALECFLGRLVHDAAVI